MCRLRDHIRHSRPITVALARGLLFSLAMPLIPTDAKQPFTEPTVRLHTGICGERTLGEVVADLSAPKSPDGEPEGADEATVAATSFSTVFVSLEDLLASDHAIDIRSSSDNSATVSCGEIGGVRASDDSLAIILRQQGRSNVYGVAFLAQDGSDPNLTNISLFVSVPVKAESVAATDTPTSVGSVDEGQTDESSAESAPSVPPAGNLSRRSNFK